MRGAAQPRRALDVGFLDRDRAVVLALEVRHQPAHAPGQTAGDDAHLEKLFVEPTVMRTGAGRQLFVWATNVARELGAWLAEQYPD